MYFVKKGIAVMCVGLCSIAATAQSVWQSKFVRISNDGKIKYTPDEKGNVIPDFSGVGYRQNMVPLPTIKVIKTVEPAGDSSQQVIQRAIDELSRLPLQKNGFRGAILLKKGVYKIPGSIRIQASGIVLRGEGEETIVIASGKGKRALIIASGTGELKEIPSTRKQILDKYVPLGAKSFTISDVKGVKVGDRIVVFRPGSRKWIEDIQMHKINQRDSTIRQWTPKEYDMHFERNVTNIQGNKIFIDNPVVMAMEEQYGGGEIYQYSYEGRINNVAVENLRCESAYTGDEDEDHGWDAVHFNKVEGGWVRNVTAVYFGYACVNLGTQCRNVTVTDCKYLQPKSKITGSRRYSFNNDGQLNLFMNCFASEGRHDYVTGYKVLGPNVFYNCKAEKANADIGPHHRWATGTLYDNITTDGEINAQDRGDWGTGHGWAGVNQVFWNCTAAKAAIQNPWASAKNYVIGLKGGKYDGRLKGRPDAEWEGQNKDGLFPQSLYMAQLQAKKKNTKKQ